MPTYEYRCGEGHTFETVQKITDEPVKSCPVCGACVQRVVSTGTSFILKGRGWAADGYEKK